MVKTGDVVEGRYRVVQTLGEGQLGAVYLAEHMTLGRRVALKVLRGELANDASVIERFMTETRKAGTLGNANIVESLDIGLTSGLLPYVVFEYLEGALLTDEIYRVGGLPVRRTVRIAQQIASALAAAHAAGIVHGALESDTVFLVDKDDVIDHVKVIDFGVARLAARVGTPEFLAPERITTRGFADKRADVYALGVMMYEMLTARRPFSNDDDERALMHRIVTAAPPPMQRPDVPKALEELVGKLLSKDPAARPSAEEVESALAVLAIATPRARTTDDIARRSDLIPRPATLVDTAVSLAQLPVGSPVMAPKRLWMMYGIAAAGLLVGGAGFAMAMRSSQSTQAAPAPAAPPSLPAVATQAPTAREVAQKKIDVRFEANVPNARVTFRRRVSAAPATMQIGSSDIVELVEVSAPGYKTTRYWLTFDRPTHLTARLAKGTGLEEASEEATLIALGEVAPPAEVAVPAAAVAPIAPAVAPPATAVAAPAPSSAVVTVAPASKTVERRAPAPAVEPRKIGRALAEPAWESPTAETPVAETPKVVEAPAAEVPKAVEAPAAEAPKVVEAPKAIEAPKAEVTVAKPAIDRAMIASVIAQHRPEVLKCIADGKKKSPDLKGTMTLQLQVDSEGRVRAQIQSTLGNPLVSACVIKAANTWRFPPRADGDHASIAYPFTIN